MEDRPMHEYEDMFGILSAQLLSAKKMKINEPLWGCLTRKTDYDYSFVEGAEGENASEKKTKKSSSGKRNQKVFEGNYINVTENDFGELRLNFRYTNSDFVYSIESYALAVANEIVSALTRLMVK